MAAKLDRGEIVGDHPMSKTKFRNNMKKMLKK